MTPAFDCHVSLTRKCNRIDVWFIRGGGKCMCVCVGGGGLGGRGERGGAGGMSQEQQQHFSYVCNTTVCTIQ